MSLQVGGRTFIDRSVADTVEFRRVLNLPRREWTEASASHLSVLLTQLLATPLGTQTLRPIQAQSLHDAGVLRGGFFPIRVGGGKTILSLLLAYVIGLRRPLLLIPASLKEKTRREAAQLSKHWRIPLSILRIESYEQLSTPGSKFMLFNYRPDGIITDESHRLRASKTALVRRIKHYMDEFPDTRFVAMSGTITKKSLHDYAHLAKWCLKDQAPLPSKYNELEDWAAALDEAQRPLSRTHPGALMKFTSTEDIYLSDGDETRAARLGFRRRLTETPGVVATNDGFHGASIYIDTDPLPVKDSLHGTGAATEGSIARLRDDAVTPDDWPLTDAMSLWRHVRELALEFYYRWDPRPPFEWLQARRVWFTHIREILKDNSTHLDSDFVVTKAVIEGRVRREGAAEALRIWQTVEPTFLPNSVPVWMGDTVLKRVASWLARHPRGIAWVEHVAFGERLSTLTGLPYFGRGGMDSTGRTFYDPATNPGGYRGPCIASLASNSTGRNLQHAWSDNYIVSCPPGGDRWEQLLGRTHRDGQEADQITATVFVGCIEHLEALNKAIDNARYIQDSTGQAQKLLFSDVTLPQESDIKGMASRRYQR